MATGTLKSSLAMTSDNEISANYNVF